MTETEVYHLPKTEGDTGIQRRNTCPDVFCEDCTKECEVKKIGLISEVEK